jgi:hypothetical protein
VTGFWHTLPMNPADGQETEREVAALRPASSEAVRGAVPAPPTILSSERAEGSHGASEAPKEIGGPKGPEPTRYGDWERAGRCIDF